MDLYKVFFVLFQLEIHHRTKRGKGAKCFFLICVCGAFILKNFHHFDEFCFFMFLFKFYLWNMLTYMYFVLLLPFTRYKMVNMWLLLKIEISLIVYDALLQWMRWWWCLLCTRPTGLVGFLAHLANQSLHFLLQASTLTFTPLMQIIIGWNLIKASYGWFNYHLRFTCM